MKYPAAFEWVVEVSGIHEDGAWHFLCPAYSLEDARARCREIGGDWVRVYNNHTGLTFR